MDDVGFGKNFLGIHDIAPFVPVVKRLSTGFWDVGFESQAKDRNGIHEFIGARAESLSQAYKMAIDRVVGNNRNGVDDGIGLHAQNDLLDLVQSIMGEEFDGDALRL